MKLIILFGSRSRGDFTEHSDYDVLVVDDDIPKDPRRVSDQLYAKVLAMFPGEVDPVFMNSEVFLKKVKEGVPFVLQILEEGKVIEKDEEFWKETMKIYNEIRPLYERRGKSWIRKR
ncbi:nucleotidyltransferase domain-containing protein [Metallosphaera hakonensis]|uniref:Nucleotidyltransferase domain-containing protein n=1 Tax=Metallosphaera hakonensis JCM 8857 = DSM 7519 TaxID=1293036 RepID=A0A2U9IW95_9CREN|nr:nucleotidyltransferase domain-containing protein [Metallosphaera hakonensis]AWS00352.1 nucleotidyltransferase domain-containing protein [Metallosphaera hakonensis JCM 8857 = DSM 7519]